MKKLMIIYFAVVIVIVSVAIQVIERTSRPALCGWTEPQHEIYEDGSDDWISYPIYGQCAPKVHGGPFNLTNAINSGGIRIEK